MKRSIPRIVSAILCTIFVFSSSITLHATDFRDVGSNQAWAREAIDFVSTAGIMTGDLQGNFNPADPISKFDTVRILSRMSGFNPDTLSPQDAAYYNAVFEARRSTIEAVSGRFTTWNSNTDREIAYLLYTGVLIPSDLENFIIIYGGQERLRALTREEAAVFLVRFMGRTQEALRTVGVPSFSDDHLISPGARPHVYLLRHLGILNGDGSGNVNPRGIATRAVMAVLVQAVLEEMESPTQSTTTSTTTGSGVAFETMTGTITNTYPSFRSILTVSSNAAHNNRIFPISQTAIITINGLNANFGDLTRDMNFTAIVHNGEIMTINIQTQNAPQQLQPVEGRRIIDGSVARVNPTANTIGIETRMLNLRNEIIFEVRDFTIAPNAAITRGGQTVGAASIEVGDMVVAITYGNQAHSLELEERVRQVTGTLMEKNFSENSLFPLLVIQDSARRNHSFTTDAASNIYRFDMGNIPPRSLRIGDDIEITAEFGRITNATARGEISVADVYIRDIFIAGREQSYIVVSNELYGTPDRLHLVIDGAIDMYALTIGSQVRLWLDSQEVLDFSLLASASVGTFTGHITHVSHNEIVVRDANFNTRTFTHDIRTVFFNSMMGMTVHVGELFPGMRVQIVADANNSGRVASVTVLTN
ncbi:MAG: S-layer homology domain-containing protein [Defluviitaleaceae bacterium]|nr:S-layer homology domain-containing protein [Defluviitaleaceae bacterium]